MTTDVILAQRPLGAAFVGGGFMAEVHSRAARSARATLVGAASSSPKSARRAADRLGLAIAYDSPAALFGDDSVDVVHICTPNTTHAAFALAAMDAGRHVICEKPLATSIDDAEALIERVDATGVTATVPFVYRYHPMVREARAKVAAGELGTLLTINGSYLQDWLLSETDDDWRVDSAVGGPSRAFADIGSHLCDLVEFVTGDRITRVAATKRTIFSERATHRDIDTEDAVALVVETATGAIGTLLVSQVAPGRKNRLAIEISGSAQTILFDQEQPESLWLGRRTGSEWLLRDPAQLSADAARLSVLPAGHPLGYQDAFNAFVADSYAAARGEVREGLPTFADGLRAVRITAAVLESSAQGGWVDVPEFVGTGVNS
jgi:predicted dehydrogenase